MQFNDILPSSTAIISDSGGNMMLLGLQSTANISPPLEISSLRIMKH